MSARESAALVACLPPARGDSGKRHYSIKTWSIEWAFVLILVDDVVNVCIARPALAIFEGNREWTRIYEQKVKRAIKMVGEGASA